MPPYRRVVEASACENGWNSLACAAAGIPMPVSVTSKRRTVAVPSRAGPAHADGDAALAGELHRVPDQVQEDLAQAPGIAIDHGGHVGLHRAAQLQALGPGALGEQIEDVLDRRRQVEVDGLELESPASIFDKSSRSLMRVSNASPERRAVSAYSRCSGVSGVSSSSPVIPMTPFIGVRISWLMAARKSLLARLAASAASLACRCSSSACLRTVTSL